MAHTATIDVVYTACKGVKQHVYILANHSTIYIYAPFVTVGDRNINNTFAETSTAKAQQRQQQKNIR
jgi:hypothetical protein